MLCLTRKYKQKIIIEHAGVRFSIKIGWVENGKARLVFDAPDEVKIFREEIQQKIDAKDDIASTICPQCFGGKDSDVALCEGCSAYAQHTR